MNNQKEWLEEYEHGKGIFYSEYSDTKTVRLVETIIASDVKYCTSSGNNNSE